MYYYFKPRIFGPSYQYDSLINDRPRVEKLKKKIIRLKKKAEDRDVLQADELVIKALEEQGKRESDQARKQALYLEYFRLIELLESIKNAQLQLELFQKRQELALLILQLEQEEMEAICLLMMMH